MSAPVPRKFCGKCGGPIPMIEGESIEDFFCMGCEIYICFECHLRLRMPTGTHTSAAHSLKPKGGSRGRK